MTLSRLFTSVTMAGLMIAGTAFGQAATSDEGYQAAMLADADSRSGMQSSHDADGFFLSSDQGDFTLRINGGTQVRYYANFADSGSDDLTTGFEMHNTLLIFSGDVHDFGYNIRGNFDDLGMFYLENAWIDYSFGENSNVLVGQFILPFMREDSIDDFAQLSIDRSVVNEIFNQGYSQGVQFTYNLNDQARLSFAFSDGFDTSNTTFSSMAEADYALTGRVDWLADGDWYQFNDFTSERGEDAGLLFGVAAHYQEGGETGGTVDMEAFTYTGDVSYENDGWNAFASGVGRSIEGAAGDFDDFGVVLQGGYRLTETDEAFVRFDGVFADNTRGLMEDEFRYATIGYNKYFYGHSAKFTVDVVVPLEDTAGIGTLTDVGSLGLMEDMESGDAALRVQMQLSF